MHEIRKTQAAVCRETGIEYTALNTFLNKRKGMWFRRVQQVLDCVGLSARGSIPSPSAQSISKAAWVEMRCRKIGADDVAERLGVSGSALNGFLNGRGGMRLERVEALMKMLDIRLVPRD